MSLDDTIFCSKLPFLIFHYLVSICDLNVAFKFMETLVQNYTYGVNKKVLSVHSVDRDLSKYPNANEFDIELPVEYKNVVGMRLNDITMPNVNNYSLQHQNTKLTVSTSVRDTTITIRDGFYSDASVLLQELIFHLTSTNISVQYDAVRRKFIFTSSDPFEMDFTQPETYEDCGDSYYPKTINWGLGSYLGFNKKKYTAVLGNTVETALQINFSVFAEYYIMADNITDFIGERMAYMELALFNSMDELEPYANRSSDDMPYKVQKANGVKFGGKHNAAFAKFPIGAYSSWLLVPFSIFMSDPPLERLQRLRFKFRYHDGRPIDFNDLDFTFTIEITLLRSEMPKFQSINSSNFRL